MSEFNRMILDHSDRNKALLEKLTAPLCELGITYFWYYSLLESGEYSFMCPSPEWAGFYFQSKAYIGNPFLRHPKNYQEGICLERSVQNDEYQRLLDFNSEHAGLDHSMVILEAIEGGYQGFGFSSQRGNNQIVNVYFNQMALLKQFIAFFKERAKPLVESLNANRIDLASLVGPSFYGTNEFALDGIGVMHRQKFVERLNLLDPRFKKIRFTPRELQCITLYLQGKSANQIGESLSLSRRTIEYYLENIKIKLDCNLRAELFEALLKLEHSGLYPEMKKNVP